MKLSIPGRKVKEGERETKNKNEGLGKRAKWIVETGNEKGRSQK